MLKNKFSAALLAGAALLSGAIGGTAFLASAQTATTANVPIVNSAADSAQSTVDKPESANDAADTGSSIDAPETAGGKVDTDNVQAGPGSTIDQQQVNEHQDADSGAQSETSESASSTDVSEQ